MISVIIPVYNAAKWLPQCLDSILGQSYRDIEIIVINDASTDRSLSICQQYAASDERIILIDKLENEGVESARQSGYSIARGDYVMYVDADDWLEHTGVLLQMFEKAEEMQVDYVAVGWQRVFDRHKWLKRKFEYPVSGLIEQPELGQMSRFFILNSPILDVMWGKLYRKSILDQADIHLTGMIYGEDTLYNMQLFPYLKRIYFIPDIGYNYRYGGMSCRYNPQVFVDLKRMYGYKKMFVEKCGFPSMDTLNVWLKNVLKSEIIQRIEFGRERYSDTVAYIREEMCRPLYDNFQKIDKSSEFWDDPFVHAFYDNDAEKIYEICRRQVRKEHLNRRIKRFVFNTFLNNL